MDNSELITDLDVYIGLERKEKLTIASRLLAGLLACVLLFASAHSLRFGDIVTGQPSTPKRHISVWATDEPSGEIGFIIETSEGDSVYVTEGMLNEARSEEGFTVSWDY